MPDYLVVVACDGTGTLKVRAETEEQAREDAEQMDAADIEWSSPPSIQVLHVERT